jgi:hypothetical protein
LTAIEYKLFTRKKNPQIKYKVVFWLEIKGIKNKFSHIIENVPTLKDFITFQIWVYLQ